LGSILSHRFPGSRFLDLYAGTGAVGIEALSRGAIHVTYVESSPQAVTLLRRNLFECGLIDRATISSQTVQQFLANPGAWGGPYDILFADPPYGAVVEVADLLSEMDDRLLTADACVIIEHGEKTVLPSQLAGRALIRRYRYGDTALSLFSTVRSGST
jgi:16S rRNA (guanine(966)-N(2))-methyltransferase RsmD